MSKESVAPQERVNIVYRPATGDTQSDVELPLKLLMLGDYTCRSEDMPIEDRKPINVDKDNFEEVLRSQDLRLCFTVPNKLTGKDGDDLPIELRIIALEDFGPESIVRQVPELNRLLQLRAALQGLKGPLGNVPAFRRKIEALVSDAEARPRLLKELKG